MCAFVVRRGVYDHRLVPYLRNQKFLARASLFGYSQPLHELFYRSVGSDHAVCDWTLVVPEQG